MQSAILKVAERIPLLLQIRVWYFSKSTVPVDLEKYQTSIADILVFVYPWNVVADNIQGGKEYACNGQDPFYQTALLWARENNPWLIKTNILMDYIYIIIRKILCLLTIIFENKKSSINGLFTSFMKHSLLFRLNVIRCIFLSLHKIIRIIRYDQCLTGSDTTLFRQMIDALDLCDVFILILIFFIINITVGQIP